MVRLENNGPSRKAVPEALPPRQTNAAERRRLDELLDDALEHTFPASDPVAIVPPARPKAARRRRAGHDEGGSRSQDSDLLSKGRGLTLRLRCARTTEVRHESQRRNAQGR